MNTQVNELQNVIASINAEIVVKKEEIEGLEYEVDHFEYSCTESEYDYFLDQNYGEVNICGLTYSASSALKNLDPIAYSCSKSDYESNFDLENCAEYTEKRDELEQLQDDLKFLEIDLEQLQDELDNLENEAE